MKLYFLRHGLAGDRTTWKGDDAKRPLTAKGKKQMLREAQHIAKLKLAPDLILTSPLVRASQTAEILAKELGLEKILEPEERLGPDFDVNALREIVNAHSDAGSLVLVGHEPSFSETVSALIGGGRLVFKKGGLALVDLPNPSALRGELVWLLPPKALQ